MEDPSASPRLPIYPIVPQIDFPRYETPWHSQSNQLEPIATVKSKCMGQWSPASSPHKLGKAGPKRRRTVTVHGLHVSRVPPTDSQQSCNPPQNTCSKASTSTLTLEGFQESSEEKTERECLGKKTFLYMVSKQAFSTKDGSVLKEFKEFFAVSENVQKQDPFTIHYMEILDENPDSNDTMKQVPELLLDNISSDYQRKYVILVGDGKTYDHLMQIKHLYGSELQKLLIFPGDWHKLKNYQPVLMKIYYCAGLKELAKGSGYRGETLTSLEKCSNFKRTHHFLLQAWQGMYRQMLHAYMTEQNTLPQLSSLYSTLKEKDVTTKEFLTTVEGLLSEIGQNDFQAFIQRVSSRLVLGNKMPELEP